MSNSECHMTPPRPPTLPMRSGCQRRLERKITLMNRILLLHVSVGMGHQRAALALARAFAAVPNTTALVQDTLDYSHTWYRRGYVGVYLGMAAVAPRLWSRYYAQTDRPNRLMNGVRALSTRLGVHEIAALIERAQCDAIVCTHFLPLEALAQLRQQH